MKAAASAVIGVTSHCHVNAVKQLIKDGQPIRAVGANDAYRFRLDQLVAQTQAKPYRKHMDLLTGEGFVENRVG